MNLELLTEFFHYNPDTGVVTWKKNKPPRGKAGEPVGYVGPQGYLLTYFGGKSITVHRLAWVLHHQRLPTEEVMLRDGDKTNFKPGNLLLRSEATPVGPMTLERLREVISYDPETGLFSWLSTLGKARIKDATTAGCLSGRPSGALRMVLRIDGHSFEATRVAYALMTGVWLKAGEWMDHKDGSPENNRWVNLRKVTAQQNASNQGDKPPRREGLPRGVEEFKHKDSPSDYGYAMMHKGVRHRERGFSTQEEAHEAYKKLHAELHGTFSVYASRSKPDTQSHPYETT